MRGVSFFLFVLTAAAALASAQPAPLGESACVVCHRDPDVFDEEQLEMVRQLTEDIHAEAGLSCHDCHGGNPDPRLAADADASMDPNYAPNPFKGSPSKAEVPAYCGRCHSDPAYMRQFRPDIRVDQESEYWTSQHGEALRGGDFQVAACVDCHHAHGILRASNPRSPVYPTRVADTCASCHADPVRMEGRKTADGRPLPVDQKARWSRSVHARALLVKEDLTAPTCNDCHGNHSAVPPGLESIAFVCGQCHGREATLFRRSAKHDGWLRHNEYLEDAGSERCGACHAADEPAAQVADVLHFGECTTCHGNHGVIRPTVALFSPLPEVPCVFCHEGDLAEEMQETADQRREYQAQKERLLQDAQGLEGDALFNHMVDMALQLPFHSLPGLREDGSPELRPEFARLFDKFRIGKTYYVYQDPTGQEKRQSVVRCTKCHTRIPEGGAPLNGRDFLESMRQLTTETAAAERILLSARRGGIETRDAFLAVDRAVDAQIALEALVHTFSVEGAYTDKQQEGLEHAREALAAGRQARSELVSRRSGLAVSLVLIALVLVGLALKIRQVSGAS